MFRSLRSSVDTSDNQIVEEKRLQCCDLLNSFVNARHYDKAKRVLSFLKKFDIKSEEKSAENVNQFQNNVATDKPNIPSPELMSEDDIIPKSIKKEKKIKSEQRTSLTTTKKKDKRKKERESSVRNLQEIEIEINDTVESPPKKTKNEDTKSISQTNDKSQSTNQSDELVLFGFAL